MNTEQNRTEQNRTEQNRIQQNRTEQNTTEQNRTEQLDSSKTLRVLFFCLIYILILVDVLRRKSMMHSIVSSLSLHKPKRVAPTTETEALASLTIATTPPCVLNVSTIC
jgi:hypothetical protein